VRDTKPKNEELIKRGRGLGHVTYFSHFGTPPPLYLWNGCRYKRQILYADWP